VGVLIGDVTGDWVTAGAPESVPVSDAANSISLRSVFGGSPAYMRKSDLFPRVPKIAAVVGTDLQIPINVGDLTPAGAFSYELEIGYDPELFTVDLDRPIDSVGTLSNSHRLVVNASEPGILRIAAFGTVPFTGNGELLRINLQTIASVRFKEPLLIRFFRLDETVLTPVEIGGNMRDLTTKAGN